MRVVSINTWGGAKYEVLQTYLREVNADIVCLQEVYATPSPAPKELLFDLEHPSAISSKVRTQMFKELCVGPLHRHYGYYHPAEIGMLYEDDGKEWRSMFGIATFVRDSVPVYDSHVGYVHRAFNPAGWGDPPHPRNAHLVRVHNPDNGRDYVVVHMHGIWTGGGKEDTPERDSQAHAFTQFILQHTSPSDRIVCCGDFNVLPTSITFKLLKAGRGLVDLVVSRGFTDTRTSLYKKTPRYADYMLITDNVVVKSFDVPAQPEMSDHRPLVLDFE